MDLDSLEKEIREIRIKLCDNVQKGARISDEEQALKRENLNLINEICFNSLRMLNNLKSDK